MKYEDLLNSQLKYNITKENIITNRGYENILEKVVIAPWWDHTIFDAYDVKIEQVGEKVYNIYKDNISFSYVELKRIGSPAVMDYFLSLGLTKCKKILFIGSAGALVDNAKIGDLVIPSYSICGDGASRYLNKNLEDEFLKKEIPYGEFTNELIETCNRLNYKTINVPNFSVDTIFAQYNFIDEIKNTGAQTIEMETALLFKCSNLMKIPTAALFCISDNTISGKSLYSDRTKENEYRHKVRKEIIPNIIIELFK